MARFLGSGVPLLTVGEDKYQLLANLHYYSDILGKWITVPEGFVTDLDSTPRWLPAVYALLREKARRSAIVHDYLYDEASNPLCISRSQADAIFWEAARVEGAGPIRGWLFWAGVRLGGYFSYKDGKS